jgi:butyrate kinase
MRPIESGVYAVNDAMLEDLRSGGFGEHASNLGAIIASRIATAGSCPAFIADPVVVDELDDLARWSGVPEIERRSIFHALNHKSAAREAARRLGRRYEDLNMIVAHLGGGVSVGAHRRGRVVDVNNALDGDGPFAPERSGGLPAGQLVDLALAGTLTQTELRKRITGRGGLVAYCGTNDLSDIERRIEAGDERCRAAFEAMIYQISKEIAMHGATLSGRVDLVVLTGGMAHNARVVDGIRDRVSFLAPVEVIPGEREMVSLAAAACAALSGEAVVRSY